MRRFSDRFKAGRLGLAMLGLVTALAGTTAIAGHAMAYDHRGWDHGFRGGTPHFRGEWYGGHWGYWRGGAFVPYVVPPAVYPAAPPYYVPPAAYVAPPAIGFGFRVR